MEPTFESKNFVEPSANQFLNKTNGNTYTNMNNGTNGNNVCRWTDSDGQVCGKTFPKVYSLGVHLRIHQDARPFKCDLCPKNFRQKAHLQRHRASERHGQVDKVQLPSKTTTKVEKNKRASNTSDSNDPDITSEEEAASKKPRLLGPLPLTTSRTNLDSPAPLRLDPNSNQGPTWDHPSAQTFFTQEQRTIRGKLDESLKPLFNFQQTVTNRSPLNPSRLKTVNDGRAILKGNPVDERSTSFSSEISNVTSSDGASKETEANLEREELERSAIDDENFELSNSDDGVGNLRILCPFKSKAGKVCGISFRHRIKFSLHFFVHFRLKPFVCSVCSEAFSKSTQLERHVADHVQVHRESGKSFVVISRSEQKRNDSAGKKIKNSPAMLNTISNNATVNNNNSSSTSDDASFNSNESPDARPDEVFESKRNFCCLICSDKFADIQLLKDHLQVHRSRPNPEAEKVRPEFGPEDTESDLTLNEAEFSDEEDFDDSISEEGLNEPTAMAEVSTADDEAIVSDDPRFGTPDLAATQHPPDDRASKLRTTSGAKRTRQMIVKMSRIDLNAWHRCQTCGCFFAEPSRLLTHFKTCHAVETKPRIAQEEIKKSKSSPLKAEARTSEDLPPLPTMSEALVHVPKTEASAPANADQGQIHKMNSSANATKCQSKTEPAAVSIVRGRRRWGRRLQAWSEGNSATDSMCHICGKKFDDEDGVIEHLYKVHVVVV